MPLVLPGPRGPGGEPCGHTVCWLVVVITHELDGQAGRSPAMGRHPVADAWAYLGKLKPAPLS